MNNIVLRALELDDVSFISSYVNDYEIYSSFTDSAPTPKSLNFTKDWVIRNSPSIITFAIEEKDTNSIIGTCQLRNINEFNGTAWLSIIIGDSKVHGKGYGTTALNLLLQYAFNEKNLRKVTLRVYDDNPSAKRLYEKVGFIEEGVLKEEIYRKGKYCNQIQMSILKDEFTLKKEGVINE